MPRKSIDRLTTPQPSWHCQNLEDDFVGGERDGRRRRARLVCRCREVWDWDECDHDRDRDRDLFINGLENPWLCRGFRRAYSVVTKKPHFMVG